MSDPAHETASPSADSTRQVALGGILAALAVALNHALALVPNVELTSLTIFLAGWILGPPMGAAVGAASALAFSLTNPLGRPSVLMLGAQLVGYACWGGVGGLARGRAPGPVVMGAIGLLGTLGFQLLMQYPIAVAMGTSLKAAMVMGAPFVAAHMASNTVVFVVLGAPLATRLSASSRFPTAR